RLHFQVGDALRSGAAPGEEVVVRFAAADDRGIARVALAVRPAGADTWTAVQVSAESGGWRAALPPAGAGDTDVRLEVEDAAGNRLVYLMEPALAGTTPPVRFAAGMASLSAADTIALPLSVR